MSSINVNRLKKITTLAETFGFDHAAITRPKISDEDKQEYFSWVQAGHAGGMQYMNRDPQKRADLTQSYPGVQSVLTLGVSYYQGPLPEKPGKAFGRVARYAWGLDYHDVIFTRLKKFLVALDELFGEKRAATVAIDTKPILERALAKSAGLGFIGKNTVLIIPRQARFHVGSWVFLTEVLLDAPLADDIEPTPLPSGCGSCTKCLTACPTDAFEKPYSLKADKCISYLTIENKGWIPREHREAVGDWLFGCDVCQDVCPFNARAYETRWPEFKANKGVGCWVSLKDLFRIPDQQSFKKRWGQTPLSRAKRKGILRNACVVAGNSQDETLVPDLKQCLNEAEPLVRGHAVWALSKLMSPLSFKGVVTSQMKKETDSEVKKECEAYLELAH